MKRNVSGVSLIEIVVVIGASAILIAIFGGATKMFQGSKATSQFQKVSSGDEVPFYELVLRTGRNGQPCQKGAAPIALECNVKGTSGTQVERFTSVAVSSDEHSKTPHSHVEYSVNSGSGFVVRRTFVGIENFAICDETDMRSSTHECRTDSRWTPTKMSAQFAALKSAPSPIFFRFRFDVGTSGRKRSFQGSFLTRNELLRLEGSKVFYQTRTMD